MESTLPPTGSSGFPFRAIMGVFKLRIGVVITFTALAGLAVSAGPSLSLAQLVTLTLAVLVSSASAGAFNQYYEHDIDPLMSRTRKRPFATGEIRHGPIWLLVIGALMVLSVGAAWIALNAWTALFVFLGAFFYAIVYTVWLKRRTWLNIVFGGLAGSWAVLAGATAAAPQFDAVPLALAFGLGAIYFAGAAAGGFLFIQKAWRLVQHTSRETAMTCFHASLAQLTLVLTAAIIDARF